MLHSLAGRRQVFFGVFEASHLFQEQGSKLGAVGVIDLDVGAPLSDVKTRLGGHASCQSGHEPRVAVLGVLFRDLSRGVEAIVPVAQGVLEIVARTEGLGAQNVVQVQTFVATDGGCCGVKGHKNKDRSVRKIVVKRNQFPRISSQE